MKTSQSIHKISAALICLAGILPQPSFAVEPKELYTNGMNAYSNGTGDLVKALEYLFAYKVVMVDSLDVDPIGKNKLEAVIIYCETKLDRSTAYAISEAAVEKRIKINGAFNIRNPYLDDNIATIQSTLDKKMKVNQMKVDPGKFYNSFNLKTFDPKNFEKKLNIERSNSGNIERSNGGK